MKVRIQILIGCLFGSLLLAGCGGSDNDDGGSNPPPSNPPPPAGTEISGTATAPGGSVAMLEGQNSILIAVVDFLIPRAYADITGLEPVNGATVELIRIDNTGAQIGDVLATTSTSVTGDYTLTVPAGTDLSGDLVVRISGVGVTQMRAQIVEEEVDINPVSEFVLQKFIEDDTDLSSLTTDSVIKLVGQVEEFDLTATADLESMLAALEEETGVFVEDQIAAIEATPGDGGTLVGDYRGIAIGVGLSDDDQQYGSGSFSQSGDVFELSLADTGNGVLDFTHTFEEGFWANQHIIQQIPRVISLSFFPQLDTGTETEEAAAQVNDSGVIVVETAFEEEIDGDFGWRYPPNVFQYQTALNTNLFVGIENEAWVRYRTIDTNDDQIKDAVDPAQREGDEVEKNLVIVAERPDSVSNADLNGDYGRVYYEVFQNSGGVYNVRVEDSILNFDGVGLLDISSTSIYDLSRTASPSYSESTDPAEQDLSYSLSTDGRVITVEGGNEDVMLSSDFNFAAIFSPSSVDDGNTEDALVSEVSSGTTLAIKLPDTQLDLSARLYRVFFQGISTADLGGVGLTTSRFNTTLTVNNDGLSGVLDGELLEVSKANAFAEVETPAEDDILSQIPAEISLASNGAATIVITDGDEAVTLSGFFSQDGSLGIFHTRAAESQADPDELGVAILVEIN